MFGCEGRVCGWLGGVWCVGCVWCECVCCWCGRCCEELLLCGVWVGGIGCGVVKEWHVNFVAMTSEGLIHGECVM